MHKFAVLALALFFFATSCTQEKTGGVALYTLRDDMGKNPTETLEKVAEIGYQNIEAAGYENGKFYKMTPVAFKTLITELKLNPMSSHHSSVTLENADTMMADVKAARFQYFVVPIPPMGMFKKDAVTKKLGMEGTAKDLAIILNQLGEKSKDAGLRLLYHNHDFEFSKDSTGTVILDYLIENSNPELVNFQMDLYWATKAGVDPVDYFKKYPGRFKSWHVKDMDAAGRFAPVGKGSIDFKRILGYKELSGMEYYLVEQDMTFDGLQPIEAIIISHKALQEIGFD